MRTSNTSELYNEAIQRAQARYNASPSAQREIIDVQSASKRLFPDGVTLSLEETEQFRMLCRFGMAEPKPVIIRSHRKFIGPLIVSTKKLLWRIVSALLKDSFESQRVFNRMSIRLLAELRSKTPNPEHKA